MTEPEFDGTGRTGAADCMPDATALSMMFGQLTEAVIVADAERRIVWANAAL